MSLKIMPAKFKNTTYGTSAASEEDPGSISNTIWCLTTIGNSSSRGSVAIFWPP